MCIPRRVKGGAIALDSITSSAGGSGTRKAVVGSNGELVVLIARTRLSGTRCDAVGKESLLKWFIPGPAPRAGR
jgi:hypothetical protein